MKHQPYQFLFRRAPATVIQEQKVIIFLANLYSSDFQKLVKECIINLDDNPTVLLSWPGQGD